jgi:hypothetical protein
MMFRPMRIEFELPTAMSVDEAIQRLADALEESDCPCSGPAVVSARTAHLSVPKSQRRLYSPRIDIEIIKRNGGSVVGGLIGPEPDVWTFFAFTMFALIIITIFAGIAGVAQFGLNTEPWAWFISIAALIGSGLLFVLSRIGQRLAEPKVRILRHVVEKALNIDEAERARTDADPYHELPA